MVAELKKIAKKVLTACEAQFTDKKTPLGERTYPMVYFKSLFEQKREPHPFDRDFSQELEYVAGLNLSGLDWDRALRIMSEEVRESRHPILSMTNDTRPLQMFTSRLSHPPTLSTMAQNEVDIADMSVLRQELRQFAESNRDRVAFAMLKGGDAGGMNPIAAPLIRRQIKRIGSGDAFDDGSFVVGGAVENLSIEDWLHRWGDSPSMGKQLDRMASHAQGEGVAHMALAQGGKLAKMGGDEYIAWFKRLQENREVWNIPQEEVSIMRDSQEYLASGVQELMMILDKPISGEPDAQDLLKRVVGATNPLKADDDTIRAKMRDELDLKKRAEFPFIRNIIHCPKREEQELELGPMSDETVRIFVKAARQYNAFRNN